MMVARAVAILERLVQVELPEKISAYMEEVNEHGRTYPCSTLAQRAFALEVGGKITAVSAFYCVVHLVWSFVC